MKFEVGEIYLWHCDGEMTMFSPRTVENRGKNTGENNIILLTTASHSDDVSYCCTNYPHLFSEIKINLIKILFGLSRPKDSNEEI